MRVISNIHIIEDNGILDHTIIADIALLKDHGILYHTVDDTVQERTISAQCDGKISL